MLGKKKMRPAKKSSNPLAEYYEAERKAIVDQFKVKKRSEKARVSLPSVYSLLSDLQLAK